MKNQDTLTEGEHRNFVNDMQKIVRNLVADMIALADKYNVDRDDAMHYFSQVVSAMVEVATFQHYEGGENNGGRKEF